MKVEYMTGRRPAAQTPAQAQPPGAAGVCELPGFGPMTRITTDLGPFPAQTLRVGDRLRIRSGAYRPIVWLDRIVLDEDYLARHPEGLPILIRADAMGRGMPEQDVMLAPGQPVRAGQVQSGAAPRPARALLSGPRVMRKPETLVTYTVFHCGQAVDVHVDGLWVPVAP
jgi:hypothetical protein